MDKWIRKLEDDGRDHNEITPLIEVEKAMVADIYSDNMDAESVYSTSDSE